MVRLRWITPTATSLEFERMSEDVTQMKLFSSSHPASALHAARISRQSWSRSDSRSTFLDVGRERRDGGCKMTSLSSRWLSGMSEQHLG
jgi:hypothetical protein